MGLRVGPQFPPIPINVDIEEHPLPFVWPWVGVLANIPLQWKHGRFVGPSGSILKQQLSRRGFNPFKVSILCSHRGHSSFALVNGLRPANLFHKSFQATHCGNKDWNNAMACPADNLYGWIATEDDNNFEGIVGQHLRMGRDLNSAVVSNMMHHDHNQMHSQVFAFSTCVDHLMKQKDDMVQRCHEDMRKTHHSAQKHLEKIISQREKVTMLLEAQKQQIEMRSTGVLEGEVRNKTELRKIQNEKYMIEKATLEQRKGDHNLVLLVEKHKKEKEEFHEQIIDYEKDVDGKHVLQLEIERIRGALLVMRHMADAGDGEILVKMDTIQQKLKLKEEAYAGLEAMDVEHQRNNDELQGAGKELIKYLKEGSRVMSTGVIKGVEYDSKPFLDASKRKYSEEEAYEKAMDLYSEWNDYLQDPSWHHFVTVEGCSKQGTDIVDERLKCLRIEHGDEVCNAIGKKATLGEGAAFILKRWSAL